MAQKRTEAELLKLFRGLIDAQDVRDLVVSCRIDEIKSILDEGVQGAQGATGSGAQGAQGMVGAQGQPNGVQGVQGTAGVQGLAGNQGAQGRQGLGGTAGTAGVQGVQGAVGTGNQGSQGARGTQGLTGNQGVGGSQGGNGAQGAQGRQGTSGIGTQGAQGASGSTGFQGNQGATGVGSQGVQGVAGGAGVQGAGFQGIQGVQGLRGFQGDDGAQGNQGATGTSGVQGNQGNAGAQGAQGRQGVQGLAGSQGTQGFTGVQGAVGFQGFQGRQGTTGTQGATGNIGTVTASKALASNSSGVAVASTVTSTELGYLSGATSAIQTQLNNRLTVASAVATEFTSLTANNFIIPPTTITFAGTTNINFNNPGMQTVTLAGNIIFTNSGLAAGRSKAIRIIGDSLTRTLSFPAWTFVGAKPTTLGADKKAFLNLVCFGTTASSVIASYAVEVIVSTPALPIMQFKRSSAFQDYERTIPAGVGDYVKAITNTGTLGSVYNAYSTADTEEESGDIHRPLVATAGFEFDGIDDQLIVPSTFDFGVNEPRSCSMWVTLNSLPVDTEITTNADDSEREEFPLFTLMSRYHFLETSGTMIGSEDEMYIYDGFPQYGADSSVPPAFVYGRFDSMARSDAPLEIDTQYFIVGTIDEQASPQANIYVNGVLKASFRAKAAASTSPIAFGAGYRVLDEENVATGQQAVLDGILDDIRYYNFTLSEDQINTLYLAGPEA
jgi:hypothetical protein